MCRVYHGRPISFQELRRRHLLLEEDSATFSGILRMRRLGRLSFKPQSPDACLAKDSAAREAHLW